MRGPRAGIIYSKRRYKNAVDDSVFPGIMGAPQNNNIGALALAFKYCMSPEYREYAARMVDNCRIICDELEKKGNKILTGGTDTNIMVWDIKPNGILGSTMMKLGDA